MDRSTVGSREAGARIRQLESLVEEQAAQLDRLAKAKWSLPRAPKRASGGSFIRVIIPDTHGFHADGGAVAAFLANLDQLGSGAVREIVMLGDHLDCGGFLAAHHTENYVAQAEGSFEDDVNAANELLDRIQATAPKAAIDYLEGNHERRIETWCITSALRRPRDAAYLRKCFGADQQLRLADRRIRYFKQGEFYDGLPVPTTIRRGKCFFTHGARSGKHATASTLGDFGGCVVMGHIHKAQGASGATVHSGEIVAYSPGCLCKLQPLWRHTQPTDWNHGFGLQFVDKGGSFMHINVPIGGGVSYLAPLLKTLGKASL